MLNQRGRIQMWRVTLNTICYAPVRGYEAQYKKKKASTFPNPKAATNMSFQKDFQMFIHNNKSKQAQ